MAYIAGWQAHHHHQLCFIYILNTCKIDRRKNTGTTTVPLPSTGDLEAIMVSVPFVYFVAGPPSLRQPHGPWRCGGTWSHKWEGSHLSIGSFSDLVGAARRSGGARGWTGLAATLPGIFQ